jgi:hypothetical protein
MKMALGTAFSRVKITAMMTLKALLERPIITPWEPATK